MPSILANLEHRHSYVRRNAVAAINAIYKLPKVGSTWGYKYRRLARTRLQAILHTRQEAGMY